MSIRKIPNTDLNYYLVGFDENGRERTQEDGSLLSRAVLKEISEQPVTDVFVMSHGWRGDGPAAASAGGGVGRRLHR